MESELSGIFRVKLVPKNIVRGSPGTQFMHMRVNKLSKLLVTLINIRSNSRTHVIRTPVIRKII